MTVLSGVVIGIHTLSLSLWVGGLTCLLVVVLPSFSQRGDATLLMNLQKRMVKLIRPLIAVLLVSGLLSLRWGLLGGESALLYQFLAAAKVLLIAAMIAVSFRRQWWLHKYAYSRPRQGHFLLVLNTLLGWATIVLSGILDAAEEMML